MERLRANTKEEFPTQMGNSYPMLFSMYRYPSVVANGTENKGSCKTEGSRKYRAPFLLPMMHKLSLYLTYVWVMEKKKGIKGLLCGFVLKKYILVLMLLQNSKAL